MAGLDRFQDSSKTGSGINCFPTFLATIFSLIFCNLFCCLFAAFFAAFFCCLFAIFFAAFFAVFFPPFLRLLPPFCWLFLACFFSLSTNYVLFWVCSTKVWCRFLGVWVGVREGVCVCRSLSQDSMLLSKNRNKFATSKLLQNWFQVVCQVFYKIDWSIFRTEQQNLIFQPFVI